MGTKIYGVEVSVIFFLNLTVNVNQLTRAEKIENDKNCKFLAVD